MIPRNRKNAAASTSIARLVATGALLAIVAPRWISSNVGLLFARGVEAFVVAPSHFRHSSSSSSIHPSIHSLRLQATSAVPTLPNPFKKLPWNVEKERKREARRLQLERARLHRELGIAEDATYEEIVAATDRLVARAGSDLKRKIQIEVAKDKILQIRLNERLAGLAAQSREARAQSTYELEGDDDPAVKAAANKNKEWNAPKWTQGLVVKPDERHVKSQLRLWGGITAVGLVFPPAQDYLGRFTWLVCVAQLTFRGMPREEQEAGGLGVNFNAARGGGHRKVAFALGFSIWVLGAILVYSLLPSWARGQRWTPSLAFSLQNLIFGTASCYLQPYKG